MKHRSIIILSFFLVYLVVSPVFASPISVAVSTNTQPQLRPNDIAVVWLKGINKGTQAVSINITVVDDGGLEVYVSPMIIEELAPQEQFKAKVQFKTNNATERTVNVKIEILAKGIENGASGTGASLSASVLINYYVFVSITANTTKEAEPSGFYKPQPVPTGGVGLGSLLTFGFIVFIIIIVAIVLYKWREKRKMKQYI